MKIMLLEMSSLMRRDSRRLKKGTNKKEKKPEPVTLGSNGVTTRSKIEGGSKLKVDVGSQKNTQGTYTNKEIRERESKKDIVNGKQLTIQGVCTPVKKWSSSRGTKRVECPSQARHS